MLSAVDSERGPTSSSEKSRAKDNRRSESYDNDKERSRRRDDGHRERHDGGNRERRPRSNRSNEREFYRPREQGRERDLREQLDESRGRKERHNEPSREGRDRREEQRERNPRRDDRRGRGRDRHDKHREHKRSRSPSPGKRDQQDPNLPALDDDPRAGQRHRQTSHGKGRNTESFDPESTFVRPSMRIIVKPSPGKTLVGKVKHDDVLIIPELFCKEENWDLYYKLVSEMRDIQAKQERNTEWIPWHEGCHLVTKNPDPSPTYNMVIRRIAEYFGIQLKSVGTRFNWYRDSSDWKPFHHDSAAFNPQRARNQNITVGVSFGATRELAFLHAKEGTRVYFPQVNGMAFSFGRDVNIHWKHGVNALKPEEQDGKGRISIILWGWCDQVIEEENSPALIVNSKPGHGGRRNFHHGGGRERRD
eukprot:m.341523 g.341523  ORF g.341523 m.341523 type:complete len:420 (+) comp20168_c0_seq1:112-1371(+)